MPHPHRVTPAPPASRPLARGALTATLVAGAAWLVGGGGPGGPSVFDEGTGSRLASTERLASAPCPAFVPVAQLGGPVRAVVMSEGTLWFGKGPRVVLGATSSTGGPPWLEADSGSSAVLPGLVEDIAVRGPRAFVAAQRGGLLVLDLSDPDGPRMTARLAVEGLTAGVRLDGDRAYVAAGWGGLHIVDIANPDAPRAVGRVSGIVSDADVTGPWVFVVSRNLTMVDLADPANPVQRAKLAEWADAVEIVGDVLFAGVSDDPDRADRRGQLASYDIRDPGRNRPQLGSLDVGDPVRDILPLGGGRLLVLTRGELVEVDAADPARMRILRRGDVPGHMQRLAGEPGDGAVFAAGSGDGLLSVNLEALTLDDLRPLNDATYGTIGHAASIAALDDRTVLVEDEGDASSDAGRLRFVDVADPAAPAVVGQLPLPVDQRALVAGGGRVVVGHPDGSLRVVDAADPAAPREAGRLQLAGRRIWALALAGDVVWVANDDRLRAIDIADRATPREIGSVKPRYGATDVALDGGYAYVTGPDSRRDSGFDRLHVVDISNPTRPFVVADGPVDGWNDGLAVEGGVVAVGGLALYGFRGAAPPAWLGAAEPGGDVADKLLRRGVALLALEDPADGTGSLAAIDVADPRRPRALAALPALAAVRDLAVVGDLVALAEGDAGLRIVAPAPVPAVPTAAPVPTRDPEATVGTIFLPRVVAERYGCP